MYILSAVAAAAAVAVGTLEEAIEIERRQRRWRQIKNRDLKAVGALLWTWQNLWLPAPGRVA